MIYPDTGDDELIYYLKKSHCIASLGLTYKMENESAFNEMSYAEKRKKDKYFEKLIKSKG